MKVGEDGEWPDWESSYKNLLSPIEQHLKSELCLLEAMKIYSDMVQYAMFRNTAALKKKRENW